MNSSIMFELKSRHKSKPPLQKITCSTCKGCKIDIIIEHVRCPLCGMNLARLDCSMCEGGGVVPKKHNISCGTCNATGFINI